MDTPRDLPGWLHLLRWTWDDPASELLAVVWGPRFDRAHALELLRALPALPRGAQAAIERTARRFDALPARGQRRVRGRIARLADNAACRASC